MKKKIMFFAVSIFACFLGINLFTSSQVNASGHSYVVAPADLQPNGLRVIGLDQGEDEVNTVLTYLMSILSDYGYGTIPNDDDPPPPDDGDDDDGDDDSGDDDSGDDGSGSDSGDEEDGEENPPPPEADDFSNITIQITLTNGTVLNHTFYNHPFNDFSHLILH